MTDYAMAAQPPRAGIKFKYILILLLVAFVGGIVITGWLANRTQAAAQGARPAGHHAWRLLPGAANCRSRRGYRAGQVVL